MIFINKKRIADSTYSRILDELLDLPSGSLPEIAPAPTEQTLISSVEPNAVSGGASSTLQESARNEGHSVIPAQPETETGSTNKRMYKTLPALPNDL